ncbi:PXA domain-containing protein [Colletotrichum scovillei]|uniref:PXA domain-containing protein n=1 Tax=Colletotrichum scovillei TaxID=1209932 RepID=A0A9P7R732_9PEZI|nr:PXA domain-containing protein [Colletotrichum scovillei]KAG7070398.1 PXA domain-containing protein [Colletotrichum scovillei]KAG7078609.1 PXA domain-containing protein [Colletotrichum scovillei]
MAAVATPRAPTPRPKAPATVSFLNDPAAAVPTPLATPGAERTRPPLQANPSARRSARPTPTDYLSDKATAAFIRRVLCSKHLAERGRATPSPIEELLPPLTSRNDVDLQLYALISVILREYVQVWYSKITPDDTFVDEIVQIIAHCTRALEQRLRKVDLESLLFDELPDLLDRHILAYRAAHDPISRPPTEIDPREVYHSLCPLAPLTPIPRPEDPSSVARQQENETLYRQLLVQGVLAVLLPTEDLENSCLTSLVGQIFSELIIGNVLANRLSQPWLVYEIFIILTRVLDRRASEPIEEGVAEALQAGSTSALPRPVRRSWSIQGAFWSLVQWSFLAFSTVRFLVMTLAMSSSLPPRSDGELNEKDQVTGQISHSKTLNPPGSSNEAQPVKTPIAAFKLWSCVADLIEMDSRMPWLSGIMSLLQLGAMAGPGRIAGLNGAMDRLISHTIHQRLLDAALLPTILRSIRAALFPNNAPGVSTLVAPSSEEELRALRRRCASAMLASIPPWLAGLYLGGRGLGFRWRSGPESRPGADDAAAPLAMSESEADVPGRGDATNGNRTDDLGNKSKENEDEEQQRMLAEIEEGILDIFSDEYCNKHLVYSILELILVRLMPELAEKGVVELWEERLSL